MFERFTDQARRAVVLAQEEARRMNHYYIGTEHILLGLLADGEGLAAKALTELGVSLPAARAEVELVIGRGGSAPDTHIPFTPRARNVLALSLREALRLGHNDIGTEHVLLALAREGEGVAAQVLVRLGADLGRVQQNVIQLLSRERGALNWSFTVGGGRAAGSPLGPRSPAADAALAHATRLAGDGPVGTHHLVLGVLADPHSAGARALAGHQVDADAVRAFVEEHGVADTTDEPTDEAGARNLSVAWQEGQIVISLDQPDLAALLAQKGLDRLEAGPDPSSEWRQLWRHIEQLVKAQVAAAAAQRPDMPGLQDAEATDPRGADTKEAPPALRCTFCGSHQREVKKLIAGPGAYICDKCVALCQEIIADEGGDDVSPLGGDRG